MNQAMRRASSQIIENHLRIRITTGVIRFGERLPSFEQLKRQFGAAANTVDKVYGVLEREGLVERRKRSGIYAAFRKPVAVRIRLAAAGYSPEYMSTHYWTRYLQGLQKAATDGNADMIYLGPDEASDLSAYAGVVIITEHSNALDACPRGYPIVCTHDFVSGVNNVSLNEYDAGVLAARHLLELGHRRIGFMVWPANPPTELRLAGCDVAMGAVGIPTDERRIYRMLAIPVGSVAGVAYKCMKTWLREGFRKLGLTAIVAGNDWVALGLIAALRESGYRVPEDISVVGFDHEPQAAESEIPITSVSGDTFSLGYAAAVRLLEVIAAPNEPPRTTLLPVQLHVGRSTAPPAPD